MLLDLDAHTLTRGQRRLLRSTAPQVLFAGGYGAGKTLGIGAKVQQLRTVNAGVPGLIVAPTRPLLFSVTVRRLLALLRRAVPAKQMPRVRDPQGECYLDFGDGVPVFLRSATRPDSIDGLDVGWAVGDEIRYWPRVSYDVTLGRVRVKCPLPQKAFASTPSMGWMADEFNANKPGRELIVSGTRENAHNLTPGFIENLRASYSPRMQRAVIDGEFTILEGAVFEDFDPNPQVSPWIVDWQPTPQDLQRCRVMLAVDPGYRRSSWLFVAERGHHDWVVFDQLQLDDTTDFAAVERVNAKGYPVDEIWCDPAADNTQSAIGIDSLSAMQAIRTRTGRGGAIRSVTAFRDITFGIDKLRVLLGGYDKAERMLKFSRQLATSERGQRGIVKDLASLRYPEAKDGRPVVDKPLKDGLTDHSTDALRYWAVGRWMVDPELRKRDPALTGVKGAGYRVH